MLELKSFQIIDSIFHFYDLESIDSFSGHISYTKLDELKQELLLRLIFFANSEHVPEYSPIEVTAEAMFSINKSTQITEFPESKESTSEINFINDLESPLYLHLKSTILSQIKGYIIKSITLSKNTLPSKMESILNQTNSL